MNTTSRLLRSSSWSLRARFRNLDTEKISGVELEELSNLAYLELPKDNKKREELVTEISSILKFTKLVQQSTKASEASALYDGDNKEDDMRKLRKDVISEGGKPESVLKNATITKNGYFVSKTI